MTRIDDLPVFTIPRDTSLEALKTAMLAWLDDLEPARSLPTIDEHGLLRSGDRWIPLTPTEERVLRALLDRAGRLCSRALLTDAGWPRGTANDRILDTYVRRLRAKIPGFGIVIRTVRKRGFVLDLEGAVM
jgi:uroporphyrinogen-III synthase